MKEKIKMKMKIRIQGYFDKLFFISALAFVLAVPLFVSAETGAGITPNSPFYFIDTLSEKISFFFTFSSEEKAKKLLNYAEERLAEVKELAENDKPKLVSKTISKYEDDLNLATEKIKEIKDENKAKELLTTITGSISKHQEVLTDVYNKVPDETKSAIEKVIDASLKIQEDVSKQITELKSEVKELKQKIAELEQGKTEVKDEQIEILKKEMEALKRQQKSSQSVQPQAIEKIVEKIIEVPPPVSSQKEQKELTNTEIIAKVKPAVVYIKTANSIGSGMIIENDGYILTNAHVVEGVNSASIKLVDKRLLVGSVIGRDEKIDLALLKINGDRLPTAELGNSDESVLKQGDEVFALGYPFGLQGDVSFTEGTLSRRVNYEGITYLETSVEIKPGNSGGPLVNGLGQVVGINSAGFGEGTAGVIIGESIKLALPVNLARGLIPELKSGRNVILPKITAPEPTILMPSPIPTPTPRPPQPTPEPTPTPVPTDTTPPKIYNIKSTSFGDTTFSIAWETNEESYGEVEYSADSNLNSSNITEDVLPLPLLSQIRLIRGLTPGTTYYFRIIAKDKSGNETKSQVLNFKTTGLPPSPPPPPDTTPPKISFLRQEKYNHPPNFASISWAVDGVEYLKFEYSKNSDLSSATISRDNHYGHDDNMSGAENLSGLSEGTTYYYRLTAKDLAGNTTISEIGSFKTITVGSLTVSLSTQNPPPQSIVGGNKDVRVLEFTLQASNAENIDITKLAIEVEKTDNGSYQCSFLSNVIAKAENTVLISFPLSNAGTAASASLVSPLTIIAGNSETIAIFADIDNSGTQCPKNFKFGLQYNYTGAPYWDSSYQGKYNIEATGQISNQKIYVGAATSLFGNIITIIQ